MKKKFKNKLFLGIGLIIAFVIWTLLVKTVDVSPIGPRTSSVGFATVNGFVHSLTGVNMSLYTVTDWLGLVPIGVAFCFAVFGLVQWIKRKHILKVDFSILALGAFYLVVIAVYILFEFVVVNYRPVLINGYLEVSYPSSTTMLVLCVMPSAMMELSLRIKNNILKRSVNLLFSLFTAFMVIGRLVSGVHWISDIIGGGLFSAGVVAIYNAVLCLIPKRK